MQFRKYTKEQFIQAVKENNSIRQLLCSLKVAPHGGNYRVANNYIRKLNLDTSHFTGQGWNKGMVIGPKRSLDDYLSNKYPINSFRLKNRMFKEKVKEKICESCNKSKWLGKDIPLELDHIDGNHKNNNLSNLRILCPNCHAQTPTYRSKNRAKL